ncbi:MAG: methylmalonyl Co-A mutase-associated GTPase MeaB [Planctomycetota bacterium]|nr:methylmalonyl Co-A mutase-associated GTPase MeaB [Planctomycetota bacterium]
MNAAPPDTPDALAAACLQGSRRAASRLISQLEAPEPDTARKASRAVARLPLPPHTIGLTGPPGAGKSTLLDYLIALFRERGRRVGVVAVDPSSPFTGGALLGDRIRMGSHRNDSGVFIRSMGNRGASGGLASAASDALRVLGGAGFDVVLLETVGAGQAEVAVVDLADTVCVVQVPGLGDDVQLMKMGILEIADLFVVNKGDRPEAESLKIQLEQAVHDAPGETCRALRQLGPAFARAFQGPHWRPAVVLLSALQRTGGAELMEALDRHRAYRSQPELAGALQRGRLAREILWRATRRLGDELAARLARGGDLAPLVDACAAGSLDVEGAVDRVVKTPGKPV